MRPIIVAATVFATALALAGTAAAEVIPDTGYLVFKEMRGLPSVTEVHAKGTGNLVFRGTSLKHGRKHVSEACSDDAFVLAGTSWERSPKYYVNVRTMPRYLNEWKALLDIVTGGDAWDSPFRTDCRRAPKGRNSFEIRTGGITSRGATLVTLLESDGKNVVGFEDLTGTWCDGAVACTVIDYDEDGINEADIALETNLSRVTGFDDLWTTSDRTFFGETSGQLAVSDTATHEFGHFAGLDHTTESPTLTMYPFIHDGADTLGLGDMLGVLELY